MCCYIPRETLRLSFLITKLSYMHVLWQIISEILDSFDVAFLAINELAHTSVKIGNVSHMEFNIN